MKKYSRTFPAYKSHKKIMSQMALGDTRGRNNTQYKDKNFGHHLFILVTCYRCTTTTGDAQIFPDVCRCCIEWQSSQKY